MPEETTSAGSWLGDLTNEWKSAKPQEKVLIVGGVLVVAGIAYYLYQKQQAGQNITTPAGESGTPGQQGGGGGGQTSGFPIVPSGGVPVVPAGESPIFDPNGNLIGWGPTGSGTSASGTPPASTGNPPSGTGSSGTGSSGSKPPPTKHHHKHHKHNTSVLTATASVSAHKRLRTSPPQPVDKKRHGKPIINPNPGHGPARMPPKGSKPPQRVGPPASGFPPGYQGTRGGH